MPFTLRGIVEFGNDRLNTLIEHYGKANSSNKFRELRQQNADISKSEIKNDFNYFK